VVSNFINPKWFRYDTVISVHWYVFVPVGGAPVCVCVSYVTRGDDQVNTQQSTFLTLHAVEDICEFMRPSGHM